MKALLFVILAFIAWAVLRSLIGNRQDGARSDRRSALERVSDGMATVNAWGTYLFWIAIAGGIAYTLFAVWSAA